MVHTGWENLSADKISMVDTIECGNHCVWRLLIREIHL